MQSTNSRKFSKKLFLQIGIPVLILIAIASIWFIKTSQKNSSTASSGNKDFALTVTEKINLAKLKSYNVPIIIEFGSDSCIPCKQMAPIIEELNKELQGKAIIKFVDVWKNPSFADGYPLRVIPTQIFIDSKGNAYNPTNKNALQLQYYSNKDSKTLAFTAHEGTITKEQLLSILKEMGMK